MSREKNAKKQQGFSLLELSIVLISTGLLVASVIGGKALITQTKLRNLISNTTNYKTATRSFFLKYNGFPGDMDNISANLAGAIDCSPDSISPNNSICNDTFIGDEDPTSLESVLFFNHLSAAKLIDGNFNGTKPNGLDAASGILIGENYPSINLGSNSYYYMQSGTVGGIYKRSNRIAITSTNSIEGGITPSNAFLIDNKIDDGLPLLGSFVAFNLDNGGNIAHINETFSLIKKAYATDSGCVTCTVTELTTMSEVNNCYYEEDASSGSCSTSQGFNIDGGASSSSTLQIDPENIDPAGSSLGCIDSQSNSIISGYNVEGTPGTKNAGDEVALACADGYNGGDIIFICNEAANDPTINHGQWSYQSGELCEISDDSNSSNSNSGSGTGNSRTLCQDPNNPNIMSEEACNNTNCAEPDSGYNAPSTNSPYSEGICASNNSKIIQCQGGVWVDNNSQYNQNNWCNILECTNSTTGSPFSCN